MIVIGLGSGRSGTASLAKLLNAQRDAFCFHEMNPSCVRFHGTPRPLLNAVDEFQTILDGGESSMLTVDLSRPSTASAYDEICAISRVRLIGDIAFYYLSYVELIAARNRNVRFICLRRERQETIESWLRKSRLPRWRSKRFADRVASLITREPYHATRNLWMQHDGRKWGIDPVWDKCFPKFPGPTPREAIGQYYDYYYNEADRLGAVLPDRFRTFPAANLNNSGTRREILTFCGIALEDQVDIAVHVNKSR